MCGRRGRRCSRCSADETFHEGDNAQQVLIRAATTPAPPLASVAPHVPRHVGHVVDRALAFDKHDRWAGAEAMRDALREAHVATMGSSVSRESLIPLVSASESRISPTLHSESLPSTSSGTPASDRSTDQPVSEMLDPFRTSPSAAGAGSADGPPLSPRPSLPLCSGWAARFPGKPRR